MDIVDTRYFREPGTGRPHRVQVALDEDSHDLNPRRNGSTFAHLATWDGRFATPDEGDIKELAELAGACWQWNGSRTDAYRIARYAQIYRSDAILFVGGLSHDAYTGGLKLDPDPSPDGRYDGIAVVTRRGWEEAMGSDYAGPLTPAELARQEVVEYDSWARGEVYGYIVTAAQDGDAGSTEIDDGEVTDSCWGIIGDDEYAMAEGVMSVLRESTADAGKGWQDGFELTDAEFDDAMEDWYQKRGHRPVGVGWPA
jgi:hypothetical protein